ncbi:probable threonine protease PRSS50 [Equus przewalskii]|uniref:Probable threonine protease PRSS50 n=1 Tax=Equus przewalskii TaxID=9798 RepID=A0ABM2EPW7_EQUPR
MPAPGVGPPSHQGKDESKSKPRAAGCRSEEARTRSAAATPQRRLSPTANGGRRRGAGTRSAAARGAPRRSHCYLGMESRCGKRGSRMSAPAPTVLLLLLLLLRPAGCLGAGEAPGALCVAAPTDPGAPCAPSGTGPSGKPRLHRLVSTIRPQTFTIRWPDPVSKVTVDFVPTCGVSYEQDPTLRDPEAMARRWPWMVSVQANGTHICAGTLIASQWVLTVAHCLIQRDVVYSVRAGSPWIDQMVQTTSDVPVSQVIVNSKFQSRRYWSWIGQDNDIALLKLEGALKYSKYIGPICLPGLDYVMKDQSLCTVTGWGRPRADGVWPQFRTIQEKEVTVVNSTECDSVYHRFSKIPSLVRIINSQMICAEDLDREQFCYETSGEPLACPVESTWYLVGMVSWGPGCKKSKPPPIYLQISSYQHWIWERVTGQALPAPPRALFLVLPLPLSLLTVL